MIFTDSYVNGNIIQRDFFCKIAPDIHNCFFDVCEDGECSIALVNYVVTYDNGNKYKLGKRDDEPILYLNTRNVHGLEVTYGQ